MGLSLLESVKDMGKAIGVGGAFAFTVLTAGFIGFKLGKTAGLEVFGLILGLILGLVAAIYSILRAFPYSGKE